MASSTPGAIHINPTQQWLDLRKKHRKELDGLVGTWNANEQAIKARQTIDLQNFQQNQQTALRAFQGAQAEKLRNFDALKREAHGMLLGRHHHEEQRLHLGPNSTHMQSISDGQIVGQSHNTTGHGSLYAFHLQTQPSSQSTVNTSRAPIATTHAFRRPASQQPPQTELPASTLPQTSATQDGVRQNKQRSGHGVALRNTEPHVLIDLTESVPARSVSPMDTTPQSADVDRNECFQLKESTIFTTPPAAPPSIRQSVQSETSSSSHPHQQGPSSTLYRSQITNTGLTTPSASTNFALSPPPSACCPGTHCGLANVHRDEYVPYLRSNLTPKTPRPSAHVNTGSTGSRKRRRAVNISSDDDSEYDPADDDAELNYPPSHLKHRPATQSIETPLASFNTPDSSTASRRGVATSKTSPTWLKRAQKTPKRSHARNDANPPPSLRRSLASAQGTPTKSSTRNASNVIQPSASEASDLLADFQASGMSMPTGPRNAKTRARASITKTIRDIEQTSKTPSAMPTTHGVRTNPTIPSNAAQVVREAAMRRNFRALSITPSAAAPPALAERRVRRNSQITRAETQESPSSEDSDILVQETSSYRCFTNPRVTQQGARESSSSEDSDVPILNSQAYKRLKEMQEVGDFRLRGDRYLAKSASASQTVSRVTSATATTAGASRTYVTRGEEIIMRGEDEPEHSVQRTYRY